MCYTKHMQNKQAKTLQDQYRHVYTSWFKKFSLEMQTVNIGGTTVSHMSIVV